jgi:1-acyl-sn-glycerol-3-phosphate acyltransferase
LSFTLYRSTTTRNVDGARAFHCGIFLHDDAAPDFVAMAARQTQLAWLGFHRVELLSRVCSLLRIRVRVTGEPVRRRAVLFVSNHVSWADILVIGSIAPVAFVAKREVADWPLVGITAKAQRTVFVDRVRRHQTGDAVGEIVKRIENGASVALFAEGTSSDGNRVLPFRSALLGAVEEAAGRGSVDSILIQPMSICYTGQHGPQGHPNDWKIRCAAFSRPLCAGGSWVSSR